MHSAALTYRPPLTFFLIIFFILLRFLAGGRAADAGEVSFPVVLLGLMILAGLIMVNRPVALVLIIFDMADMAGWINPAAWGVQGVFKFKDAEFLLLMAMATAGLITNTRLRKRQQKTALSRAMAIFVTVIGIYVIYTFTVQEISTTLRVTRGLIYYSSFFAIPYYIRCEKDVAIVFKACLLLMVASSVTHILQTVFLPIRTLLPYNTSQEVTGHIVRLWGFTQPFNFIGVFVLFGILLQNKHATWLLRIAFAICLSALILTFGRVFIATIVVGLLISMLLLSSRGNRIGNSLRFLCIFLIAGLAILGLLIAVGKTDVVVEALSDRYTDAKFQFQTAQGSFFGHIEYVFYVSEFIEKYSGNIIFGVGFRSFTGYFGGVEVGGWDKESLIGIFLTDNGWAGLIAAMGLIGVALIILIIVQSLRRGLQVVTDSKNILNRSLGSSLISLFSLVPINLFFGAHIFETPCGLITALALGLSNMMNLTPFDRQGEKPHLPRIVYP